MSRDSQGPRKTFSKGGSSDFNKREDSEKRPRKSFGDKDKTSFSGEKRARCRKIEKSRS
jgi:hypothetical protein